MFVSFDCPPEPFWFLYLCCSKRLEILVIRPLCQLLLLNTVSCVPKVAFQNLKLLLVININVPVVYRFQKCIMTSLKADDASGLRWALTIQETHLCVGFSFYFFYFLLFHLKKKQQQTNKNHKKFDWKNKRKVQNTCPSGHINIFQTVHLKNSTQIKGNRDQLTC